MMSLVLPLMLSLFSTASFAQAPAAREEGPLMKAIRALREPVVASMTPELAIAKAVKKHPTIASMRLAVDAAEAQNGKLWHRFVPEIQVALTDIQNRMNRATVEELKDPPSLQSQVGTANFAWGLADVFGYKAGEAGVKGAREGVRSVENEIALKAFESYVGVSAAREQLGVIRDNFLPTIDALARAPDLSKSMRSALEDLKNTMLDARDSALGAVERAEIQFTAVVGEGTPGELLTFSQIKNRIPLFVSTDRAIDLGFDKLEGSPAAKAASWATAAARQAENAAKWGFFRVSLGAGPSRQVIGFTPEIEASKSALQRTATFFVGWSIPLMRAKSAAKLNTLKAQTEEWGAMLGLVTRIDMDFSRYEEKLKQTCRTGPKLTRNFQDWVTMRDRIDAGTFSEDVFVEATRMPGLIASFHQFFSNALSALSAVADIHTAVGDMSTPENWNLEHNPLDVCAGVNVQ